MHSIYNVLFLHPHAGGGGAYIYEQNIVTTLISYLKKFKCNIQTLTSSNKWHKQAFLSFLMIEYA